MPPSVSVIIPTHNRPNLVSRAIKSALAQSLRDLEVIVVVDGPDDETVNTLATIADSRVVPYLMTANRGVASTLNAGVQAARGNWVAVLADDDEWMPSKLMTQLETALNSRFKLPLISCRLIARHEIGDLIWPRRVPSDEEPLAEYLFCQQGVRAGDKILAPSTFLAPRELFRRVPFTDGLRRNEDADWLLRANQVEGFGIEFVRTQEPLVIYHCEDSLKRNSHSQDWQSLLDWARARRELLTPHAYASFVLRAVSDTAARAGDWNVFFELMTEARRKGKPDRFDWLAHLAIWWVPFDLRRQLDRMTDRATLWLSKTESR